MTADVRRARSATPDPANEETMAVYGITWEVKTVCTMMRKPFSSQELSALIIEKSALANEKP